MVILHKYLDRLWSNQDLLYNYRAVIEKNNYVQWAQKKSLHHINQENIYTKVMFKVIYCKN